MLKHKLTTMVKLLLAGLFVLALGIIAGRMLASTTQDVSAQVPLHYLAATPQNLEYLSLSFTPVDIGDSQAQGAISKDQAIAAASNQGPQLKAASGTSALLGFLSDTGLKQAAAQGIPVDPHRVDMGLVWLVTFHGVETSSNGPVGAKRYVSTEYNVVIDAKTGQYVMAFPLFDVTPRAPTNNIVVPTYQVVTPLPTSANPTVPPTVTPVTP